ncbi:MAG: AAA family ATPase, partial [Moorella sp. (in: Bacteria)]|nr:AAA family ATPase [Moorella sp. (in: firmicutes)]
MPGGVSRLARVKERYVCQQCAYESQSFFGRCPGCGSWNSLVAEAVTPPGTDRTGGIKTPPALLAEIDDITGNRLATSLQEWDRVLGGGIVPGSLNLLGGAPGIGKSTLLLQVADRLAIRYGKVLYVSGEESAGQVRLRAQRLEALKGDIFILTETDLETV